MTEGDCNRRIITFSQRYQRKRKSKIAQLKSQSLLVVRNILCMTKAANSKGKNQKLQIVGEIEGTE